MDHCSIDILKSNKLPLTSFSLSKSNYTHLKNLRNVNYTFPTENCRPRYNVQTFYVAHEHTSRVVRPLKEFKLIKIQLFFVRFNFVTSFIQYFNLGYLVLILLRSMLWFVFLLWIIFSTWSN